MTEMDAATMRREGLAFFGRMTAGQSHDVTNVLNIINELAGLQTDLLRAADAGRVPDLVRLADIADRIQRQVSRGETILRNVNRFAHSVDLPVAVFDLGEVLDRVVFLSQRTASLAKVELSLQLPEESVTLEGNPFGIQQAVFCCIDVAVSAANRGRRIVVTYRAGHGTVEVEILTDDPVADGAGVGSRMRFLRSLLEELGGAVAAGPDAGDPRRFVLRLPWRRAFESEENREGRGDAT